MLSGRDTLIQVYIAMVALRTHALSSFQSSNADHPSTHPRELHVRSELIRVHQMNVYSFPYSRAAKLDPRIKLPRPPIDSTLEPIIDSCQLPEELSLDLMRGTGLDETLGYTAAKVLEKERSLNHTEYVVPGADDGYTVILSVFCPAKPSSPALPALYHIHGGGMVSGDRFTAVPELFDLLKGIECVVVSVEYRLAPETRAPLPAEDCYSGLVWTCEHAADLNIDRSRIVVWGVSGGAALAAAVCLMARDRQSQVRGPPTLSIKAQILVAPMLDDRCDTVSDKQFEYGSPMSGVALRMAWEHVIGEDRGTDRVSSLQAPGREQDLFGLPPTYIDVGECEAFRDSAVRYATDMWRCGSTCELHVWPGAFHLFDAVDNPEIPLVQSAVLAKKNWLKRMMEAK